jgi:hypothetical protein
LISDARLWSGDEAVAAGVLATVPQVAAFLFPVAPVLRPLAATLLFVDAAGAGVTAAGDFSAPLWGGVSSRIESRLRSMSASDR